ncbi:MAG: dTDP-4-dehydrorhamnose 3,5-epimerase [Thermoanaerobaculia bacterium]
MRLVETPLPGVLIVEPKVWQDERGFFLEVWSAETFAAQGLDLSFVQDNHSLSQKGTLRGLHAQVPNAQGKLVRCTEGAIFDVAVDIRRGSPTFAHWFGLELSAGNFRQLWVPPDFAHGFCVLTERAQVQYKCTRLYDPARELAIAWNDPAIGVDWPVAAPLLSSRDQTARPLDEVADRLPLYPG